MGEILMRILMRTSLAACLLAVCAAVMDDASPVELGAGADVAKSAAVNSIEAKVRTMRKPGNHPASWAAVKAAEVGLPKAKAPPSKAAIEADLAAVDDMAAHRKGGKLHGKPAKHAVPPAAKGASKKSTDVNTIEAEVRAMRAPALVELGEGAAPDMQTQMQQLDPMQRLEADRQAASHNAAVLVAKLMPKPKPQPAKKPMAKPKPLSPIEQLQ